MNTFLQPQRERTGNQPLSGVVNAVSTAVLAVSTLVLAILASIREQQSFLLWVFVTVAVLVLLTITAQPTWHLIRRCGWWLGDRRRARRFFPQLRQLVGEFSNFVDSGRTTFESILTYEVLNQSGLTLEVVGLTPQIVFYNLCHGLVARFQEPPTPLVLRLIIDDLHTLIRQYEDRCVNPIFQPRNPQLLAALTDENRRSLEHVRERYAAYLNDLTRFWKEVRSSMRTIEMMEPYFPSPKPLQ